MRRSRHVFRAAVVVVIAAYVGIGAGRFDQKLPAEKQIVHALNRLTFGPRAGDVEQVRRIGLEKWIDQQLRPDQIAENPILESKLKSLSTLQLPPWQIAEKYPQVPAALMNALPGVARVARSPLAKLRSRLRRVLSARFLRTPGYRTSQQRTPEGCVVQPLSSASSPQVSNPFIFPAATSE
jgi:hypothetical protein